MATTPGRYRRAAECRRTAATQRELLSRACARPVHRDPPRPPDRSPQTRPRRSDFFGCRSGFADGGSRRCQMDRGRRVAAALCRSSPRRADRSAVAGAATPRRPDDRRCALLGAARPARSVRAGQPVRRARGTGGRYGFAPSAGRARSRPCGQDVGALGRRHAARYRREAGTRLDRARPHHGKRRLVEPRPLGIVRRDAAAHCGA